MRGWIQRNRIECWLGIVLFFTFAYFYQSGQHNENARFDQTRSIVEHFSLRIDRYVFNSADVIKYDNRWYPNKAPGTSFAGVIPYFLSSYLMRLVTLPQWIKDNIICYLTTLGTIGLISAFSAVLLFRLLVIVSGSTGFALCVTLAYSLGTIAFPFSTMFFSHQLGAACLLISFYILFTARQRQANGETLQSPGLFVLSGFLAGYAFVIDYQAILFTSVVGLYCLLGIRRKTRTLYFLGGVILAGLILVYYNLTAFHKLFYIPYEVYAETPKSAYPEHRFGFVGVTFLPELSILYKITFDPQRGLFYCNPVLLLAIPGLIMGLVQRRFRLEVLCVGLIALSALWFNASYGKTIVYWGGGYSTGPRHIIAMLPFLAILVALAGRKVKILFYPLALVSIFFMLTATAVEPRLPYEYTNPLRQLLIPYFLRGMLAIGTAGIFTSHFLTANSVSFNLGKLCGLGPQLQLLPLYIWWIIGAIIMGSLLEARLKERPEKVSTTDAVGFLPIEQSPDLLVGYETLLASEESKTRDVALPRRIWLSLTRAGDIPVGVFLTAAYIGVLFVAPILYQWHSHSMLRTGGGLTGRYYRGTQWSGTPFMVRKDSVIFFEWDKMGPPLPGSFSVEWNGAIEIESPGIYTFITESDDGSRLYIDNRLVVDNDGVHAPKWEIGKVHLSSGRHSIRLRYYNAQFGAVMKLFWKPPDKHQEIVPATVLHDIP
jgi:hypothetical protein